MVGKTRSYILNKDTKELTEKWVLTHKYDNQTNTAIYTTDIPEIEIEKVEVRAQGRKLSQPYHMIEVEDLEPEDYIEYMTQVFDEAKGYLQFGHVSVSDTG